MPLESFVIEVGEPSSVVPSKDLTNEITVDLFEEDETLPPFDKDFFSDTTVYFVGSHSSMFKKDSVSENDAIHTWILEPKQFNFID